MAWYKSGTVAVINGSRTVTGTGTAWVQGVGVGEAFYGPDGKIYEIERIDSSTVLTLVVNYAGATAAGQAYSIMPTQSYIRDLAAQAASLISQFADIANSAGSGKFAAGSVSTPSLRGIGDENTGVNLPGGDTLQLVTAGQARVTVAADGTANHSVGVLTPFMAVGGAYGSANMVGPNGIRVGPLDGAGSSGSNLQIYSWFGVGICPSFGSAIPTGENSHWFDARSGNTGQRGSLYVGTNIRAGQLGAWSGEAHTFQSNAPAGSLTSAFGGTAGPNVLMYSQNGAAGNVAACSLWVNAAGDTGRGINSGGTVNASGSDYAEYHSKAASCGTVEKGQVVCMDVDDQVTDRWSAAISYAIKSTDPSYVGGDVWGTATALGLAEPQCPEFEEPDVRADIGTAPSAPAADASPHALAAYQAAMEVYMDAHAQAIARARVAHEAGPLAVYQVARAEFEAVLEAARQQVDRIAYSGRVPVNVLGAATGDYLVAAEGPEDTIIGLVLTPNELKADMTRYLSVVGRVRSILPDGRANVAVVVH